MREVVPGRDGRGGAPRSCRLAARRLRATRRRSEHSTTSPRSCAASATCAPRPAIEAAAWVPLVVDPVDERCRAALASRRAVPADAGARPTDRAPRRRCAAGARRRQPARCRLAGGRRRGAWRPSPNGAPASSRSWSGTSSASATCWRTSRSSARAPAAVVERERARLADLERERAQLGFGRRDPIGPWRNRADALVESRRRPNPTRITRPPCRS